ncbi:unnamed protein product [Scytosiphon promiscuus]
MAGTEGQSAYASNGSGAAAFRVQNQIRRNAQDMQEYLAELGSWEKSIKKKDRKLARNATVLSSSTHKTRGIPDTDAPPIRHARDTVPVSSGPAPRPSATKEFPAGAADTKVTTAGAKSTPVTRNSPKGGEEMRSSSKTKSNVSAAGHTYDKGYDKWAKFDIDAALRSVDQEDAGKADERHGGSSNSDSDTDGEDNQVARKEGSQVAPRLTPATMVNRSSQGGCPPPPPQKTAPATKVRLNESPKDLEKEERERGNAKFGQGDFEGAVKCYTRCLAINGKSSLAFSNRAMAYVKLKEFGKAEADADAALRVDPRHVKSLQRRAAARNALGKHRAALGDLQTAAEMDPSSKQVRKDLSKTLETLKAVMRRAPKSQVKVESAPLPAPKPRDYSGTTEADEQDFAPSLPARPCPVTDNPASVISATNENAPVAEDEDTPAPYSSVLRNDARANGETNLYSYQARTTVEELPEEAGATALRSQTAPANAVSPGHASPSPVVPVSAPCEKGRATGADFCQSVDRRAAVGHAAETLSASETRAALLETIGTKISTGPSATENAAGDGLTDLPNVPAVGTAKASKQRLPERPRPSDGPQQGNKREGAGSNNRAVYKEGQPKAQENGQPSLKSEAEEERQGVSAPTRTPQRVQPSTSAPVAGTTTQRLQLPTTGYQFEHMWRSTDGSPEARLELLRLVPPSSVSKFFRRTPIEVDLLGSILQSVGEAFLPKKPATAARWLKSLSKASRFSMTVALLGEADGRAAVREILCRLEKAPSAKVDPNDIRALREQYLL